MAGDPLGLQSGEPAQLLTLVPTGVSDMGRLQSFPLLTSIPGLLSSSSGCGFVTLQPVRFLGLSVQVLTNGSVSAARCSTPSGSTLAGKNWPFPALDGQDK